MEHIKRRESYVKIRRERVKEMSSYLYDVMLQSGNLSLKEIALRISFSIVIGGAIYLSYWLSHYGTVYSKKFNVTLVILTVLTTTVMTVIGNNVALSLGMVGALSIIRFRTSIKDSRDIIYIFWTIVVGICGGVGDFVVASVGSCAVFLILLLFGSIKSNSRTLLVIRADRQKEQDIRKCVFSYFDRAPQQKVCNSTQTSIEFVYEISKKSLDTSMKKEESLAIKEQREALFLMDRLYRIEGVEYVNLVMQSDEIA